MPCSQPLTLQPSAVCCLCRPSSYTLASSPGLRGGRREEAWYRLHAHALGFPYTVRRWSSCTEKLYRTSTRTITRNFQTVASTSTLVLVTANWLAIDCWKLIFTTPVHSTPEKVLFLDTNLQLLDTGTKPSFRVNHCCRNLTAAFFITH